jgi:D-glycero-alpha-D-manno-heptose-7-phosphate kinase
LSPYFCCSAFTQFSNQKLLTGISRKSDSILKGQKAEIPNKAAILGRMKEMVETVKSCLLNEDVDALGPVLHQGWIYKKQLSGEITNPTMDGLYDKALCAGATGGKVVGAGGGGFFLVYCLGGKQDAVRNALCEYRELPFRLEGYGTKVIFSITR